MTRMSGPGRASARWRRWTGRWTRGATSGSRTTSIACGGAGTRRRWSRLTIWRPSPALVTALGRGRRLRSPMRHRCLPGGARPQQALGSPLHGSLQCSQPGQAPPTQHLPQSDCRPALSLAPRRVLREACRRPLGGRSRRLATQERQLAIPGVRLSVTRGMGGLGRRQCPRSSCLRPAPTAHRRRRSVLCEPARQWMRCLRQLLELQ
mmetsp:Transcript_64339/g.191743  ORF Transcript_64339/g.191743 Transcript_64339/m.191743 type:complete len:207 (+) Transcript_64339:527-1147(+)